MSRAGGLDAREALQPAFAAELVLLDGETVRFAHPLVAEAAVETSGGAAQAHRALAAVAATTRSARAISVSLPTGRTRP